MREREGEPSSEGEKRKRELKLEVEVRDGDWESKRVAAMWVEILLPSTFQSEVERASQAWDREFRYTRTLHFVVEVLLKVVESAWKSVGESSKKTDSLELRSLQLTESWLPEVMNTDSQFALLPYSYLFHPFVLASCLSRSTGPISNAALLIAIASSIQGTYTALFSCFSFQLCSSATVKWLGALHLFSHSTGSLLPLAISLSLSIHLTLTPLLLAPSLVHLYSISISKESSNFGRTRAQVRRGRAISSAFGILAFLAAGAGLCHWYTGGWEWVGRCWGTMWVFLWTTRIARVGFEVADCLFRLSFRRILLPDLSPTTSLWWYFFISLFEHFRSFFLLAFNVHLISYVVPLGMKYR